MDTVLRLEGLEKTYQPGLFRKPVRVLRGLDLEVRAGETYGFLGVNGAGKTTTFKIVLGLIRPTGGSGCLFGRRLGDREARGRIGFLPEFPAYYAHLSAREVLRFARDLSGAHRDDGADSRLLESLGVGAVLDRRVRRLSKGELQRLGLAQALVHEPELLILDEPMSGLDPVARGLVKDRLRQERDAGRTVVLSTHLLADVESLADRIGLLQEGRLRVEGTPTELLAGPAAEVRIQGAGPLPRDLLEGMPPASSVEEGRADDRESWTVRLAGPEPFQVDACLKRIIRSGGRIIGVETRRDDLERLFVRWIEEDRACEL